MPFQPLDPEAQTPETLNQLVVWLTENQRGDWEVEVFSGRPLETDAVEAPMKFGTPFVVGKMDPNDESPMKSGVNLVYGPVMLWSNANELLMQVPKYILHQGQVLDQYEVVRTLARPVFEFGGHAAIRAEGFERAPDNSLTYAVWEIRPFVPADAHAHQDRSLSGS